jgi:tetratricopeptide (TPR) repeat protein
MITGMILLICTFSSSAEDISLCKQGWAKTESGKHKEAITLFESCITKGALSNSSKARTYRNIGIANERSGQFTLAIASYDKALSFTPSDSWNDYVNRGNSWSELGDYDKAVADYQRALKVNPNEGEAYYNWGIVDEKQGNNDKAVLKFKQAYAKGLRTQILYERFVAHGVISEKKVVNDVGYNNE